jgi:hypothetical protein
LAVQPIYTIKVGSQGKLKYLMNKQIKGIKDMVNAHEIFLGFTRYYNSLNIVWDETLSTHTNRLLSYFDELGRMLGYSIITENTLGNLISPCPEVMEKYLSQL